MATATIEGELMELEKQYWTAICDKDAKTALRLTENPSIVTGAQGVASLTHESFEQMLRSPGWELHEFELSDVQVRALTDDVAIVAYNVKEIMSVNGKPLTLKAADASTWVRRDGRWVCALHTESIAGDPFGRDRQPPPQNNEPRKRQRSGK